MKFTLFIQARMGSSRLPNKTLLKLREKTVIEQMVNRCKKSKYLDDIVVCTTSNYEDDDLIKVLSDNKIKYFRGSESNVLDRYYQTSLLVNSDVIIRCTGDCPLIDHNIIDNMIENFKKLNVKHYRVKYYNGNYAFPDGFDVEMFTRDALEDAHQNAVSEHDKEHVTPYIARKYGGAEYEIPFDQSAYENLDLCNLHLSLDNEKDYKLISNIYDNLYTANNDFTIYDVLNYLNNNSHLVKEHNEPIDVYNGKGQQLYVEAKTMIPGGTQLLSKRPEMFLPNLWPSYYQKASGIEITTLDGVKMKDFCYMGIGACILGYKDPDVNREIHKAVDRGNMSTLNCPSEVELTKLLCEIHPWANAARYTRSSGEACSVAVRIARASSGKDKIAFCGYHGWHDWYLAANWNDNDALNGHLITGLNPLGVPKALKNTAFPFKYNKIEELEHILENHDIGTIIMEPMRSEGPKDDFLHKVRKIATEKNIILIFDEVSAGFRINTGGIHLTMGVNPDMAVLGKALGNGYPIGAVIGKHQFMDSAQNTFISSTFWTEDIGFTAALATIKKHRDNNVGEHIKQTGTYFQDKLRKLANETDIKITVSGLPAMTSFSFDYPNGNNVRTLYTQIMLERHILGKNALYLSYAHKKEDIDYYLINVKEVFEILKEKIETNTVESSLISIPAHQGFYRLA